jgi:hypothetical protein
MEADLAEIQAEISRAVTKGDRETLARHIAPDVVWNGGAAEGGLDGIDMFFSAVEHFQTLYTSWEVIPQAILVKDRIVMVHQIDRVTFPDGMSRDLRFNLYVEYNEADQILRVWEYGGNAPIQH